MPTLMWILRTTKGKINAKAKSGNCSDGDDDDDDEAGDDDAERQMTTTDERRRDGHG